MTYIGSSESDLLLGCVGRVYSLARSTSSLRLIKELSGAQHVAEYRTDRFIASLEQDKQQVNVYLYTDTNTLSLLFSFRREKNEAPYVSASLHHVVVTDDDNCKVQIYNRSSKTHESKELPGLTQVLNVHLLDYEMSLLSTGYSRVPNTHW